MENLLRILLYDILFSKVYNLDYKKEDNQSLAKKATNLNNNDQLQKNTNHLVQFQVPYIINFRNKTQFYFLKF